MKLNTSEFNLDNFYDFVMNDERYKKVDLLEVFRDIKRVLSSITDEDGDYELDDDLREYLDKQNGSNTIIMIVDFIRSLYPNLEILYLPKQNEIEDFAVDVYKRIIEHPEVPIALPNSTLFHGIVSTSDVFETVEWLRGAQKVFYILSKYPLDFSDVVYLCDMLTTQEIQKEEVKLIYSIA